MLPSKPCCSHQPQLQRCIKLVRDKGIIGKMYFWDLVAPSRKIRREEEDDKDGEDNVIVGPIGYRPTSCFFLLLLLQSLSSSSSFPHFYLPQTPQPIHFLKAYDNSYSKTNREHKYKDKDEYKDNDKDKDTERTTESLSVCYIFGIGTTRAFQV